MSLDDYKNELNKTINNWKDELNNCDFLAC